MDVGFCQCAMPVGGVRRDKFFSFKYPRKLALQNYSQLLDRDRQLPRYACTLSRGCLASSGLKLE